MISEKAVPIDGRMLAITTMRPLAYGHDLLFCGNKWGEGKHPEVAEALWALAATHSQQDPTFPTTFRTLDSTLQVVLAAEPKHFGTRSLPQADRCRPVAAVRRKQRPEFKAQLTVARHPGSVP